MAGTREDAGAADAHVCMHNHLQGQWACKFSHSPTRGLRYSTSLDGVVLGRPPSVSCLCCCPLSHAVQVLVAEAWVPASARPRVQEALRAVADSTSQVGGCVWVRGAEGEGEVMEGDGGQRQLSGVGDRTGEVLRRWQAAGGAKRSSRLARTRAGC